MEKTIGNAQKSNKMTFRMFSHPDYRYAADEFTAYVEGVVARKEVEKGDTVIAAYFNDDEDTYKVAVVNHRNEAKFLDLYSWDEVSRLLYENQ